MFELYLVTFNCARQLVNPNSLAPPFFDALPQSSRVPDLVAVSLQELSPIAYSFLGGSYLTPYFERVTSTVQLAAKLRSNGTAELQHVATRSLGMTALMLFATPQFTQRIRWIQAASAGLGVWNMGNKGAVAMRVGVSRPGSDDILPLTFTAAHLAPMESNVEARNRDWEAMVRNLVFMNEDTPSPYTSAETRPLLSPADDLPKDGTGLFSPDAAALFLAGDLNYRTSDRPPLHDAHETYPDLTAAENAPNHFSQLLQGDQLARELDAGRTLHHLREMPITFPPTYKYDIEDNPERDQDQEWQWAKHRYPSWCDRILYYSSPRTPSTTKDERSLLEPLVYTALPVQPTSDHRPVALSFRVHDETTKAIAGGEANGESLPSSPFPVSPHWRARRDAARRLEVLVGVASYLVLTRTGQVVLATVAGVVISGLWFAVWAGR